MRKADAFGHAPRVEDVLTRAAGAFALHRRAVVVKLQGDANDVIPLAGKQRGDDGGIHTA